MGEVSPTLQLALSTIFKTRFENHLSDKNTQSHFPLPTLAGVQTPPRNAPSYFMQTFYSLTCHGEKSCKTTWPSVSKLSWRTQCGHLGFCHYERSEVIQKQMLIARRLLLSLRSIAMTRLGLSSREALCLVAILAFVITSVAK